MPRDILLNTSCWSEASERVWPLEPAVFFSCLVSKLRFAGKSGAKEWKNEVTCILEVVVVVVFKRWCDCLKIKKRKTRALETQAPTAHMSPSSSCVECLHNWMECLPRRSPWDPLNLSSPVSKISSSREGWQHYVPVSIKEFAFCYITTAGGEREMLEPRSGERWKQMGYGPVRSGRKQRWKKKPSQWEQEESPK